jgi:hypothetical protein
LIDSVDAGLRAMLAADTRWRPTTDPATAAEDWSGVDASLVRRAMSGDSGSAAR